MTSTADVRVVLLAPHEGSSGVGDYARDFATAIAPGVREVIEFRHAAPREETALGIRRERRRLRHLLEQHAGEDLVVHCELSGGAVVPYWAVRGLRGVRVTATLHDPPRAVWYPFLTRGVSRGRVLNQAIHRPLHAVLERMERRALREVDLFVLTEPGARATRALRLGRSVTVARHVAPERPPRPPVPASQRPAAVGLFGHVYTGKGFDLVPELRRHLPEDIAIRVAGRGTETLAPVPGVEILGPLEGTDLADFFDSVRVLLMPYARPRVGGHEVLPASGTHERSVAYDTPTLGFTSTLSAHLAAQGLTAVVDGGPAELAAAAAALVGSPDELDRRVAALVAHRLEREREDQAEPFLRVWADRHPEAAR